MKTVLQHYPPDHDRTLWALHSEASRSQGAAAGLAESQAMRWCAIRSGTRF